LSQRTCPEAPRAGEAIKHADGVIGGVAGRGLQRQRFADELVDDVGS